MPVKKDDAVVMYLESPDQKEPYSLTLAVRLSRCCQSYNSGTVYPSGFGMALVLGLYVVAEVAEEGLKAQDLGQQQP